MEESGHIKCRCGNIHINGKLSEPTSYQDDGKMTSKELNILLGYESITVLNQDNLSVAETNSSRFIMICKKCASTFEIIKIDDNYICRMDLHRKLITEISKYGQKGTNQVPKELTTIFYFASWFNRSPIMTGQTTQIQSLEPLEDYDDTNSDRSNDYIIGSFTNQWIDSPFSLSEL